jgi:hypothetical protein
MKKYNTLDMKNSRERWGRYTKDIREAVDGLKDIKPENLPAFLRESITET